jgi:Fe-S-cluster containining protein
MLIVDVDWVDVLREPKILDSALLIDERGEIPEEDWTFSLTPREDGMSCRFLRSELGRTRCEIYATRPTCCVAFEPGGEHCLKARGMARLPEWEEVPARCARRA